MIRDLKIDMERTLGSVKRIALAHALASTRIGGVNQASEDGVFATTHWSLVVAASPEQASESQVAQALEMLCRAYWFPLYAFVRRQGYAASEAQDLTQSFFVSFLQREGFARADPNRGRLRSYLLGSVKHFLSHEREKTRAQKRGGGARILDLDALDPETRYGLVPSQIENPEDCFQREWAREVNARALRKLQSEMERSGKGSQFEILKDCLSGVELDREGAATQLGISSESVKVAVHRLRKRFRALLRSEIAETVSSTSEIDDEMRCLVDALVRM